MILAMAAFVLKERVANREAANGQAKSVSDSAPLCRIDASFAERLLSASMTEGLSD
jgi:hypothetical protein